MKYLAIFLTVMLLCGPSLADTVTHQAGFSFWAPDDWTQVKDSAEDVTLKSPDGVATALLFIIAPGDYDDTLGEVNNLIKSTFDDVHLSYGPKAAKINGLDSVSFEGTGVSEELTMKFNVCLVKFGYDQGVLVLTFTSEQVDTPYTEDIGRILGSVR